MIKSEEELERRRRWDEAGKKCNQRVQKRRHKEMQGRKEIKKQGKEEKFAKYTGQIDG